MVAISVLKGLLVLGVYFVAFGNSCSRQLSIFCARVSVMFVLHRPLKMINSELLVAINKRWRHQNGKSPRGKG